MVPSYPRFLHIHRFNQPGMSSTAVFTDEKHPCVSGPAQFKSMLFKGQLCIYKSNRFPSIYPGPRSSQDDSDQHFSFPSYS